MRRANFQAEAPGLCVILLLMNSKPWILAPGSTRPILSGKLRQARFRQSDLAAYSGEPVVTLEEAILFTIRNDWLLNIEIKDLSGSPGHESIVEQVVILVRSMGAVENVLVSSFNHDYLARIRRLDRDMSTGVLVNSFQSDPVDIDARS